MVNKELLYHLKLLRDLLKPPDDTRYTAMLADVKAVIYEKIPQAFREQAPSEYAQWITDLKAQYEQFCNFVTHEELIGKNIVALGGGFSSGKSSFLNALDNENALPVDFNPTTAVPTFIVSGKEHTAFAVNAFGAKIKIKLKDFRSICHGFGALKDENGDVIAEPVTLGMVLKSVFYATPKQVYENLAFVDTPGFSKPDTDSYAAMTDEAISRQQLNMSNYILFFVTADAGTLKESDIEFIKSLREDIPKLFIVSKADKKPAEELASIMAHVKSQLTINGIAFIDVLAFDCLKRSGYDVNAIRAVLDAWNTSIVPLEFARSFKQLFVRCRTAYARDIEYQRRRLEGLNSSMMRMVSEDAETMEPLKQLAGDARERLEKLEKSNTLLEELKNDLFKALKRVCGQINIDMPEPTEIDMHDELPDTLALLRNYMKANNIKPDSAKIRAIKTAFADMLVAVRRGGMSRDAVPTGRISKYKHQRRG